MLCSEETLSRYHPIRRISRCLSCVQLMTMNLCRHQRRIDTTITIEGNATVKLSCKISSDKMFYEREVLKGNGDGNYHMGEVVTIKADSAGSGEIFNKWIISYNSSSFDNPSSPKTTLPMPENYAKVTATYKPNIYDLEVQLGSGDGEFLASSVNKVDYNKLSTVLDNNNFSAGDWSIFYSHLILLCLMLIYWLLKSMCMLNVYLNMNLCIQITN